MVFHLGSVVIVIFIDSVSSLSESFNCEEVISYWEITSWWDN